MTTPVTTPVLRLGLVLGTVLCAVSVSSGTGQAQTPARPGAAPAGPAGGGASAPLAAPAGPARPPAAGILRIVAQRGEVLYDKGGNGAETTEPLRAGTVLAVHDELSTHRGTLELATNAGYNLRLGEDSWVALLAPTDLFLARGDLQVYWPASASPAATAPPPGSAGQPPAAPPPQALLNLAMPCGRAAVKGRDVRLRVQGTAGSISVLDGTVSLAGAPFGRVNLAAGQSIRCAKGQPIGAVRSLLPAPAFPAGAELYLVGEGGGAAAPALRLPAVAAAQSYRVALARIDHEAEVPVSITEVPAARPQLDLQKLDAGTYVVRVQASDDSAALGQESAPHRFLIAKVGGLSADGVAHCDAGTLPRISVPRGQTFTVLVDGAVPSAEALTAGNHKLRIAIGEASTELPLQVRARPSAPRQEAQATDYQGDSLAVWIGNPNENQESAPAAAPKEPEKAEASSAAAPRPPARSELPRPDVPERPRAEDVLFGGVGEVPFGGVRSPWARSYIGGRMESTLSGAMRVALDARWAMRNGFGLDLTANLMRAALANQASGQDPISYGNISLAARTPALRLPHLALQGIVNAVLPLSGSFLDTSIERDPRDVMPGSAVLQADARPRGGGWRVEPGLLLGVRVRGFTISTTQGLSLRVSPEVGAAYAGGLLIHNEILPSLRFVTFAAWQVNYLGAGVGSSDPSQSQAQSQAQSQTPAQVPDVGGAVGGGFEALIPTGARGGLRLGVLGRIGLGDGGVAIYGRGAFGLQLGYQFN